MANVEHLQSSFAAGVWSPRLHGRVDAPPYQSALARCHNWQITPQGSMLRRPGSIFVKALGDDPRLRLVPFPQSDGQDYLLLLSHERMELFTLTGGVPFLAGASALEFLINGDFASGASWASENTSGTDSVVEFRGGDCHLHGNRTGSGNHAPTLYQDFTPANTAAATLRVNWKSVEGRVARVTVKVTQGATVVASWDQKPTPGSTTELAVNLTAGSTYRISFALIMTTGAFTDRGPADVWIDSVSLAATSGGGAPAYELVTPWTAEQLADVRWAAEPGKDRVYFVHPNVEPQLLARNPATGTWTWGPATFLSPPAEWTGTSWPDAVEVYQSRLWLAKGNTLWASKSLDTLNFATTEDVIGGADPQQTPACAIVAPISTKGRIRWLRGRHMLLVGTDVGEYSVTASGLVVTPMDMQVRQESAFGSAAGQAADIGDHVLYLSRDKRKARAIAFSFDSQQWASKDLTFAAEHLTSPLVREIAFARDPNNALFLLLWDGTFACCTHERGEQVDAWWTADWGPTQTVAVVDGSEGSIVYMVVQRASGVLLEMVPMSEAFSSRPYCDSAVTSASDSWDSSDPEHPVVSGLGHLEGEAVEVVLDGAVEDRQTVTSGAVTLARGGGTVTIGLPFECVAETLPPATPNGRGGLQAQRARRRWVKLYLRLYQSALPYISGTTGGEKQQAHPDRSDPTPLDSPEPLFTGDVGEIGLSSDWEARGQVFITQDQPLRTEVLALFGTLAENEV